MARARNIKPGFYKNEDLAECSIWARYIFPGLWMLADREGRMEDRPKRIKGELLPFDNQDVEPLLAELATRGFLVRYRNSEGSFIQISKFKEHQSPHYSEKASVIKPPLLPESSGNMGESKGGSVGRTPFLTPPDSLNPDSLNPSSLNPDSLIADKSKVAAVPLPAWLNTETWTAYVQTRKAPARKPGPLKAALAKLEKFRAEGLDANEIVATSLANGWQGLFRPNEKRGSATPDYSSLVKP